MWLLEMVPEFLPSLRMWVGVWVCGQGAEAFLNVTGVAGATGTGVSPPWVANTQPYQSAAYSEPDMSTSSCGRRVFNTRTMYQSPNPSLSSMSEGSRTSQDSKWSLSWSLKWFQVWMWVLPKSWLPCWLPAGQGSLPVSPTAEEDRSTELLKDLGRRPETGLVAPEQANLPGPLFSDSLFCLSQIPVSSIRGLSCF